MRLLPILLGFLLKAECARYRIACDKDAFGFFDNEQACLNVIKVLPGRVKLGHEDWGRKHLWAEPQYFHPPFRPMQNHWESEMYQLPKIWRYGLCRIALFSKAGKNGGVDHPIMTLNWDTIVLHAIEVVQRCTVSGQRRSFLSGGGSILPDLVPDALGEAVLYVYEAGSRLEYIATESMVTGLAIDPFGSNTLLAETLSVNFNSSSVVK